MPKITQTPISYIILHCSTGIFPSNFKTHSESQQSHVRPYHTDVIPNAIRVHTYTHRGAANDTRISRTPRTQYPFSSIRRSADSSDRSATWHSFGAVIPRARDSPRSHHAARARGGIAVWENPKGAGRELCAIALVLSAHVCRAYIYM